MTTDISSPQTHTRVETLHSGDRFTRMEFHKRYQHMPEDFKAELIGGTVFVASPMRRQHGEFHMPLSTVFFAYESQTNGVRCADNITVQLSEDSEPQPDLLMRILPEFGGQSTTTDDDYITGPPELVAEIAHSTHAIDLHAKYQDYRSHGVKEYLVLSLRDMQLQQFDLEHDQELQPDSDRIFRMKTFPGLWIDAEGIFNRDFTRLMATLDRGLASPEHAAFVAKLEAARSA